MGAFRAGHGGENVALAALIELIIEHNFLAALLRLPLACLSDRRQ
jgi:hypothetical protein